MCAHISIQQPFDFYLQMFANLIFTAENKYQILLTPYVGLFISVIATNIN